MCPKAVIFYGLKGTTFPYGKTKKIINFYNLENYFLFFFCQ